MRLFISVDMEGIAGVVSWHQLVRNGFESERAREWLTAEVNAVCEAAFAADVSEIVIADSHYEGLNLLIDRLPESVEIVRHWPSLSRWAMTERVVPRSIPTAISCWDATAN